MMKFKSRHFGMMLIWIFLVGFVSHVVNASVPPIYRIPDVIIGDMEDFQRPSTTTLHLLRYVNVTNLADFVSNYGFDPSQSLFWYETTGATLRVGNTKAIKDPLTPAEVVGLKSARPVTPPAVKEICGGKDFWISLIENAPGEGKTTATSVLWATREENGNTASGLANAGALGKKRVNIYASGGELTSKSLGMTSFDVYSMLGQHDGFSPGWTAIYSAEEPYGWVYTVPPISGFLAGTKIQTGTGFGFRGSPYEAGQNTIGRYASWSSPLAVIHAANSYGRMYAATINMSGTAAKTSIAPGFRLLYLSYSYTHLGGIQVSTPNTQDTFNSPFIGTTRKLKLAWTVPADLVEYSDTGKLNKVLQPDVDMRDYAIQFDLMQLDASDSGNVLVENILIEQGSAPGKVTPSIEWGGSGIPFSHPMDGWTPNVNPVPTGFAPAVGFISSATMQLALQGTNNSGFRQLVPAGINIPGLPSWTREMMLRTTYQVASNIPSMTPNVRFLTIGYTSQGQSSVLWGDTLDFTHIRSLVSALQSPNGLPGSYRSGDGSSLTFYAPSEYVDANSGFTVLTPTVDICQTGLPAGSSYPMNGWQRPSATVTISNVKMEVVSE